METSNYKHHKLGEKTRIKWALFGALIWVFGVLLKLTPFFKKGFENAQNIVLNTVDLYFDNLPEDFEGYAILHMTDLHLDSLPEMDKKICKTINGLEVDLCVMTGDYREDTTGSFEKILAPLQRIVSTVRHQDGIMAVLGNHDTYLMIEPFELSGITMLINETIVIDRGDSQISVTGLDDPYYYYTDQSLRALEESKDGIKIALVHSPSMFDSASDNGYSLYLTGHTHGGQICLPGGIPVIRHLRHGKKYYRGVWHYDKMTGYTGQGVGVVGIPVRFNTQSEITLLRLHKKK
ncbi:MAG: metallophosphoesterase [Desulfobacteraceae bacterium]|nr:metallophosphoesterase [Desulfobacteraceae bacterium]